MVWAFLDTWKQFLRLVGVAPGDRNAATARIDAAFDEAGAHITDVHFFSGIQTTFTFEVPSTRVAALAAALERAGIALDARSRAAAGKAAGGAVEVEGTLAVMFPQGDPDLRREVPAVPG